MSATVESPMPWRKAHRIAANQVSSGTLFRSTSSQSNLAASNSSGFSIQSPVSGGRPHLVEGCLATGEDCVDGAALNVSKSHTACEKTSRGSLFSCFFRGGHDTGGKTRPSTQLNKLTRQLQPEPFTPGFIKSDVHHQILSKSSDRLTDVLSCEPSSVGSIKKNQINFDFAAGTDLKQVQSTGCSAVAQPLLTSVICTDIDTKSENVPSVRCELLAELMNSECSDHLQLLILDCRPFVSYNSNHIHGALNVSCSDCITRKRLLTGRASLGDLVSGTDDAKEQYRRAIAAAMASADSVQVVVYDDDTENFDSLPAGHSLRLVVSCLRKAHIDVYYLHGGLKTFHKEYSCLCTRPGTPISRSPSTPAAESCKIDNAKISQILPFLFIGNEHDAADRTLLQQLGISYILNVTSHVPLHFESDGVTYVRYPAADSGTENLRQYFDDAIQFIDGVRERHGRVMVHCQAGVSRSSTIAIAYVMARSSLSMLDAFRFVKSRRSIVAPNFNFLGQLLDFESALKQGLVARRPELDVSSQIAAEYQPVPATPRNSYNDFDGLLN